MNVLLILALLTTPPVDTGCVAPPVPVGLCIAPLAIRLETPTTIKTERLVNPWAGYSAKSGCNCTMCQTIRKYGNQKYAVSEVPFDPTPMAAVRLMLDAVNLKPEDVLYDIGSGDGRVLVEASRRGARSVGVDINADLIGVAQRNVAAYGLEKLARVYGRDATTINLGEFGATVVTLYQDEALLARLMPTLKTLKHGARIVSYAHPLPACGSEPYRVVDGVPVYRYRVESKTSYKKVCGPNGCTLVPQISKSFESY